MHTQGRVTGARTVTITKNEILTALNKPQDFILAIVEVDGDKSVPRYVRHPFKREPDFCVTSVNYDLGELLAKAEEPG
ncbi:MAG TPA: DUF3883 domain-containing protein [Thermodesulfovibrionales bacterium]|nr:DUF3883 domain-containing protein [Thermodesulfovibrionales bacterium]